MGAVPVAAGAAAGLSCSSPRWYTAPCTWARRVGLLPHALAAPFLLQRLPRYVLCQAEPAVHAVEAAFRAESLLWADSLAALRHPAETDEWFVEVHPSSITGGVAEAGALPPSAASPVVHFPAVDGMCLAGAAIPLRHPDDQQPPGCTAHLQPLPPPILVLDASLIDQHFTVLLTAEIIEDDGGCERPPEATPLRPGK